MILAARRERWQGLVGGAVVLLMAMLVPVFTLFLRLDDPKAQTASLGTLRNTTV